MHLPTGPAAPTPFGPSATVSSYAGQIIINEVMADPNAVTDANGEFFHGLMGTPSDPDWPAGNYTVVVDASNFNPGGPLFDHTSTTGGEVQTDIIVGLPPCEDTNDPVGCNPTYDEALFGYVIPEEEEGVGRNAPTNTTCQDYIGGSIEEENSLFYMPSGNKIGNVAPGVIFFYTKVTVGPGQTLSVQQSHTGTGAGVLLLHGLQAKLYTPTCGNVSSSVSQNTTTGTVFFGGVAPGTYIVQLKWSPKSLVGKPLPDPQTIFYTFVAALNGVPVPETANEPALALRKK